MIDRGIFTNIFKILYNILYIMNNSKYYKYKKNIISYLDMFNKNTDILQLGCNNIEVSKILLEHLERCVF